MSNAVKDAYKIPVADEEYFGKLHTMVLTIGFHRSGSSLVGYLLTAHPNIIMAHEPKEKRGNYILKYITSQSNIGR